MKKYLLASIVAGLLSVAALPVSAYTSIPTTIAKDENVIAKSDDSNIVLGKGTRYADCGLFGGCGVCDGWGYGYYSDYYYDRYFYPVGYYSYEPMYYSPIGDVYFWW